MGRMLEALFKLQNVERQLAEVRSRIRRQTSAVTAQQAQIQELLTLQKKLQDESLTRQKQTAGVELELRGREAEVQKLRVVLNGAKTNKEYAAILTQINTIKADNSKLEEQALKAMQEVDQVKGQLEQLKARAAEAQGRLEGIKQQSAAESQRLEAMLKDLSQRRQEASADVPKEVLSVFERMSASREGEAMAEVEVQGKKPPFEYVCGGCFMSLNAEHANALQTRDELRFCDCCGRILYMASADRAGVQ